MIYNNNTAFKIAEYLLHINAIKLNPTKPFIWASGLKSPIYCDNRIALSFPKIRTFIKKQLVEACKKHFPDAELIAGVATAGIPQGVLLAQELNLPFAYVRSSQKKHGMSNKIEGYVHKYQKTVVVEDLISTGKSSLNAVTALSEIGVEVVGMLSIFSYELNIAKENFENANCKLISLSNYNYLINTALKNNLINSNELNSLQKWRNNPRKWENNIEH